MTMMIVFARGRSSWIKTTTTTTVCRRSMVFRKTFRSNGGMASLLLSSDRKDTTLPDAIPIRRCKSFFSSYSSFAEPDPTLFAKSAAPTSSNTANAVDDAIDAQLRKDIRVMGSELGKVIQSHQGKDIFDKVETMRSYAKQWRNRDDSSSTEAFTHLVDYVSSFSNADLCAVARSFTHFLAIANAAEGHHRARRLAQTEPSGAFYNKSDSCGGAIPNLLAQGHPAEKIFQTLSTQTTELVLTAHPTEVNRRTILDKHRRIQEILTRADALRKTEFSSSSSSSLSSSFEVQQLDDALYREISSIWLSDELSRVKPTPEEEAEKGTLVVETVLWNALPSFVRKLDYTCRQFLRKPLPLTAAPVKFASWMGYVYITIVQYIFHSLHDF
jgi:phosphoenolpyruvate carboxylase